MNRHVPLQHGMIAQQMRQGDRRMRGKRRDGNKAGKDSRELKTMQGTLLIVPAYLARGMMTSP
jgi:hypothetical protein